MTRVLITGVGGFVGSHVLDAVLTRTDWSVIAVDSFRHNGAFDRATGAIHPGLGPSVERAGRVVVMAHDLTVPFSPRQLRSIGRLDQIVHIASRCSVAESIEDPGDFVRNNIDSALTVLELARRRWCSGGVRVAMAAHYVHLSTDEVHGPDSRPDQDLHRPSSPYAASKAAQEDLCHAWQRTYGIPISVVRSPNMFGERQSQLAFIPRAIKAVRDQAVLPIHTWYERPGRRSYVYAGDTAAYLVRTLSSDPSPDRGEPSWLPGQIEIDNLVLARRIADLVGRELRYELVRGESARPGYDQAYIPAVGGPDWGEVPFDQALERTVKWYLDNPGWLS